jgi:tryptophan-rich sensory protein
MVLFAAMGSARWVLVANPSKNTLRARRLLLGLLLLCLTYPFYTFGLRSNVMGLIGALTILALGVFFVIQVSGISRLAAGLVALVVGWVSFASFLIIEQLRS